MKAKNPIQIAAKTMALLLITTQILGCYEPSGSTKVRSNPVKGSPNSGINKTKAAEQSASPTPENLQVTTTEPKKADSPDATQKTAATKTSQSTKSAVFRKIPLEDVNEIELTGDINCSVSNSSVSAWSNNGPRVIKGTVKSFDLDLKAQEQTFTHESKDINFSYEIKVEQIEEAFIVTALKLNDGDDKDSFSYELKQLLTIDEASDQLGEALLKYETQAKPELNFSVSIEGGKLKHEGLADNEQCLEPVVEINKINFCTANTKQRQNLILKGSSVIEANKEISLKFDFQNAQVLGSDRSAYTLTCKYR